MIFFLFAGACSEALLSVVLVGIGYFIFPSVMGFYYIATIYIVLTIVFLCVYMFFLSFLSKLFYPLTVLFLIAYGASCYAVKKPFTALQTIYRSRHNVTLVNDSSNADIVSVKIRKAGTEAKFKEAFDFPTFLLNAEFSGYGYGFNRERKHPLHRPRYIWKDEKMYGFFKEGEYELEIQYKPYEDIEGDFYGRGKRCEYYFEKKEVRTIKIDKDNLRISFKGK